MATTGKVKTLYKDKTKTEAIFPKTKISAISDSEGKSLEYLLDKKLETLSAGDNISIIGNTVSAINVAKSTTGITILQITQAQYDALATKDSNTLYLIV